MHFKLRLIPAATAAVLLVACGGGSNSPLTAASYTPSSGIAVDGYLRFSKVVCDTNDNGVRDATEPSVYTLGSSADSGKFTFPQGCASHALFVTEGTNADTGLMFTGMLMAPAGATVVSPLTTLMAAGMTQAQVIIALGLPAGTDLMHTDPLAQTDLTTYKKAQVVQQILQKSAELLAGMASLTGSVVNESLYAGMAVAFATALKASSSPLIPVVAGGATPVVDVAVLQSLLTAAVQAGQQILASGQFGTAAQTALSGIDLSAMAAVVAPALQVQAQTLLVAPDADLTARTSAAQSSTYITDYIKSIETQLAGSTTSPVDPTVIAALSATLASDVATGHNSIAVGAADTVLVTFDETTSVFADPNTSGVYGSAALTVGPGPAGGGSSNVMTIAKDPSKSDAFGGVFFAVPKIPFAATQKKISAKVYSSNANATVLLKLQVTPTDTVEVASTPTGAANTWSTVTWDFSAVDITKSYTTMAITPYVTTAGFGTYYIDDITLLAAPTASTTGDYLTVANNAISLTDRGVTTPLSLTAFQATPGVSVKWPLSSPATLNVTLAQVGNFTLASTQTLKAAVQIAETGGGQGKVMAYIDNVSVSKTGSNITISVPTSGSAAKVYGVSTDGAKKAVIDFSNSVKNVTNTLSLSGANSILFGDMVNYAINNVSNDFTGITGLRGTYKVTIVVSDLPLKKADGSAFAPFTINVPTTLDASGAATSTVPVTGLGLEGYITLTN
jgi:hypothetical protein